MFSCSELVLILFVALLVLGPKALQNLISQLSCLLINKQKIIAQLSQQWVILKKKQCLEENTKQARKVDEYYRKK